MRLGKPLRGNKGILVELTDQYWFLCNKNLVLFDVSHVKAGATSPKSHPLKLMGTTWLVIANRGCPKRLTPVP
jgi:hypothetical protein